MKDFYKGDILEVVDIGDCDEGIQLGDLATMDDRTSVGRQFIQVHLHRTDRLKQLDKDHFTLNRTCTEAMILKAELIPDITTEEQNEAALSLILEMMQTSMYPHDPEVGTTKLNEALKKLAVRVEAFEEINYPLE